MKFMLMTILSCLTIYSSGQESQDNRTRYSFGEGKDKVHNADRIVFFGYDASQYMVTVPERELSDFNLCNKLGTSLQAWMNSEVPPRKLKRKLRFNGIKFEPLAVQMLERDNRCLTGDPFVLGDEELTEHIQSYKIPDQYEDEVGFVCVLENLNKKRGYASMYFVFFNCGNKEILYATHMYSKRGKTPYSIRRFFGSAIWKSIKKYKRHYL